MYHVFYERQQSLQWTNRKCLTILSLNAAIRLATVFSEGNSIRLRKLLEKIEIPAYNFYALRDTFAVRCLEKGMAVEDLSYVLGHATVSITAERYKGFEGEGRERIVVLKGIME